MEQPSVDHVNSSRKPPVAIARPPIHVILHWQQLALHYGGEVGVHRHRFEAASQTTFGLLCCRFASDDYRVFASDGEHAEAKLLRSPSWQHDVLGAVHRSGPHTTSIVTSLVLNRSPCRDCVEKLITAMHALHRAFPLRTSQHRFLLAALGAYEDQAMVTRTTGRDLVRLREAGWELCVLQLGSDLTARGEILREGIERVAGRGIVRLG
jgi:hypothetical protein